MRALKDMMVTSERLNKLRRGKSIMDVLIDRGMVKTDTFGWVYSERLEEAIKKGLVIFDGGVYWFVSQKQVSVDKSGSTMTSGSGFLYTTSSILKWLGSKSGKLEKYEGPQKKGTKLETSFDDF